MNAATLPALIQRFFTDRLCVQMEASRHTVAGYRDTFRLLLRFASETVTNVARRSCARIGRREALRSKSFSRVTPARLRSVRSRRARFKLTATPLPLESPAPAPLAPSGRSAWPWLVVAIGGVALFGFGFLAGRFDVVAQLAKELEARRLAGGNVVPLGKRRGK